MSRREVLGSPSLLNGAAADRLPRGIMVIPTYNEAENIPRLLPRLLEVTDAVDVLVVDDASPDGTGAIVKGIQLALGRRVQVIHRKAKSGRGGAVMTGFRRALEDPSYQWFGEMDADLSHRPEELNRMLTALAEADVIVGARYLPGGRIEGWSWRRRAWSRMSNSIIRFVLQVPISDYTNGYRLYSRMAAETLARAPLRETGYIALSEWIYELHRAGMVIRDVPTVFINRRYGKSNMSAAEAVGALRALLRLRGWIPKRWS